MEAEVLAGPNFKYGIEIEKSSIVIDEGKAYLSIEKAVTSSHE